MSDFVKVMFEADHEWLRGFVRGWCTAHGLTPVEQARNVLWPQEWDVQVLSFFEGIVEALRPGEHTVVLMDSDLAAKLITELKPWSKRVSVRARQPIHAASFEFHFEIFDRDEAEQVRAIFEELPDGVHLSNEYAPETVSRPGHHDGMYAPSHEYICRAEGSVTGPLRAILDLRERCRQHERIRVQEVTLQLGPDMGGGE
jgi:hypothetical protein